MVSILSWPQCVKHYSGSWLGTTHTQCQCAIHPSEVLLNSIVHIESQCWFSKKIPKYASNIIEKGMRYINNKCLCIYIQQRISRINFKVLKTEIHFDHQLCRSSWKVVERPITPTFQTKFKPEIAWIFLSKISCFTHSSWQKNDLLGYVPNIVKISYQVILLQ